MDEKEKAFILSKNILDKRHAEYLAYMEIAIVSVATLMIGVIVFLLSAGSASRIADAVFLGSVAVAVVFVVMKDKLDEIKTSLKNLQ